MPALLTRMSRRPTSERMRSAAASIDARSQTSRRTARPPSTERAAASPAATSRAPRKTLMPREASSFAICSPIPLFAPVTSAVRVFDMPWMYAAADGPTWTNLAESPCRPRLGNALHPCYHHCVATAAHYFVESAQSVTLPTALPTLHAFRSTSLVPRQGVKPYFAVGRIERGRSEWWSRGRIWRSAPGSLIVKEMGDVHRDIALEGPNTCLLVTLPLEEVRKAREAGVAIASPLIDSRDPGGVPLRRLLDAVMSGADRLTLEIALVEAVATFGRMSTVSAERTRPVRRAVEYLRA